MQEWETRRFDKILFIVARNSKMERRHKDGEGWKRLIIVSLATETVEPHAGIPEKKILDDHNGLFCLWTLFQAKFTHHSVVLHKGIKLVLNGNQKPYGCKKSLGRREALLCPFHKMGDVL